MAPLGAGFPLYFKFKKQITFLLFILSICVGIPGTIIIGTSVISNDIPVSAQNFTDKLTIGSIFNVTFSYTLKDENMLRAEGVMWFNLLGILIMLFASIFIRRSLKKYFWLLMYFIGQ